MSEFELIRKLKEIAKRKGKTTMELVEEKDEEEYDKDDEFDLWGYKYFPIHDYSKELHRAVQEHRAKELQRDYETLKVIHDYSEKLEALQEHMEMEKQGGTEDNSEINSENEVDSGFEVEVDSETIEGIDSFQDIDHALSKETGSNIEGSSPEVSSEGKVEVNQGFDLGSEIGPELDLGSGDVGTSSDGLGDVDIGSSSVGNANTGSVGNASGSSGSSGAGGGNGGN